MELTTESNETKNKWKLFMMSKIQNLNGTHNSDRPHSTAEKVVYDVKDTKFEWNSQQIFI